MERLTIYDLAQDLGLSVSTVSKAFNGRSDINKETREHILARARALNFEPTMAARSNTTKRSYMIGVVYSDKDEEGLLHPHFSVILENFRKTIDKKGYHLLFLGSSQKRSLLQSCKYRGVDGVLIMAYDKNAADLKELLESGLPSVLIDFELPGISSILSDNKEGMKKIVSHCWEQGHRDFAVISMPECGNPSAERIEGIKEELLSHGCALKDDNIVYADHYSVKAGIQAMDTLLARKDLRYSVVLTTYDRLAYGAMISLANHGLRVPEDISLTGFDDLQEHNLQVRITTLAQLRDQIGKRAAEILMNKIENPKAAPESIRLETPLVVGDTVRKLVK